MSKSTTTRRKVGKPLALLCLKDKYNGISCKWNVKHYSIGQFIQVCCIVGWFEPIALFLTSVFSKTKSRHWDFQAYCIDLLYSVSRITRQVNFSEISRHWDFGGSIFLRVCALLVYKWQRNYYLIWLYTVSIEYFPLIYAIFPFGVSL